MVYMVQEEEWRNENNQKGKGRRENKVCYKDGDKMQRKNVTNLVLSKTHIEGVIEIQVYQRIKYKSDIVINLVRGDYCSGGVSLDTK